MREIPQARFWLPKVAIFVTVSLILTVTGPFGTDTDLGTPARLVFWLVIVATVGFWVHVFVLTSVGLPAIAHFSRPTRVVLGVVAGALPAAAFTLFTDAVFRPPFGPADRVWVLWLEIAVVALVPALIEFRAFSGDAFAEPAPQPRADEQPDPARADPAPAPPRQPVAFLKRLAPDTGTDIVSLTMNDHYVEVTTTEGREMILMRMGDAVRELDGIPGARLHRSHWAALAHATALVRVDGKMHLQLDDGRLLPVSQTYLESVQEALTRTRGHHGL